MALFEVKNIARDLHFALCVTFSDAGYYFPARACYKEHFTAAFCIQKCVYLPLILKQKLYLQM